MSDSNRSLLKRIWDRYDETKLIKAVFFGMLTGVIATLYIDYQELQRTVAYQVPDGARSVPVLPSATPGDDTSDDQLTRPEFITTPAEQHRNAMTVELVGDGVLRLTGTIDIGSAEALTSELEKIAEYVKIIELDSPGGSLEDALAMGRAIRDGGFATRVKAGALCASACPLVLAGGLERTVDAKAAIGLHQIYTSGETLISPADALAGAQASTARIARYLDEMGIEPSVWTFALETPPAQLYYLSATQLAEYKLVTG